MTLQKLTVELAKGAVKTYTAYPATAILGYLIDIVSAQESATRRSLERIEGMVSDIQENPLHAGNNFLQKANQVKDSDLKRDRIIKAQDEFVRASNWKTTSDPLLPIKAQFFAGVCDDLLNEPTAALKAYEDAFKKAKELEKLVPVSASYDKSFFDRVEDTIEEWFEGRGREHKAKQALLDSLFQSKNELESLLDNLLTIIIKRKGVSREEYLKPWEPRKRKRFWPRTGSFPPKRSPFGVSRPSLANRRSFTGQAPLQPRAFGVCPTCKTVRKLDTCPVCSGQGKAPMNVGMPNGLQVPCRRCNGQGKALVCRCDRKSLSTPARLTFDRQRPGKKCVLCGGRGVWKDGKTKCFACGGTGIAGS